MRRNELKPIDLETRDSIVEDYTKNGLFVTDLSKKYGHCSSVIRRVLHEENVTVLHGKRPKYDKGVMLSYAKDHSIGEVAKKFNISLGYFYRIRLDMGYGGKKHKGETCKECGYVFGTSVNVRGNIYVVRHDSLGFCERCYLSYCRRRKGKKQVFKWYEVSSKCSRCKRKLRQFIDRSRSLCNGCFSYLHNKPSHKK